MSPRSPTSIPPLSRTASPSPSPSKNRNISGNRSYLTHNRPAVLPTGTKDQHTFCATTATTATAATTVTTAQTTGSNSSDAVLEPPLKRRRTSAPNQNSADRTPPTESSHPPARFVAYAQEKKVVAKAMPEKASERLNDGTFTWYQ